MSDDFFNTIKNSLEDGIKFNKGKLACKEFSVPKPAPKYTASKIKKIRKMLNMSQPVFAKVLNISTRTIQSWEQDIRRPDNASCRLLQVLEKNPEIILELK